MKKVLSVVLVICLAASLFSGCAALTGKMNEAKLVGTWENKVDLGFFGVSYDKTYIFNDDGTGSMPVLDGSISLDINFTYTVEENTLTIVTDSENYSKTLVYTMAFEEDTLTLTDQNGEENVLTKVTE